MGILAAIGAYSALGAVSAGSALAIGGAALVGTAVASTELGWMGESTPETQIAQQLLPVDKTSGQDLETLSAPELGSETAKKKKTPKASFSNELITPVATGLAVGDTTKPATKTTGVQI